MDRARPSKQRTQRKSLFGDDQKCPSRSGKDAARSCAPRPAALADGQKSGERQVLQTKRKGLLKPNTSPC